MLIVGGMGETCGDVSAKAAALEFEEGERAREGDVAEEELEDCKKKNRKLIMRKGDSRGTACGLWKCACVCACVWCAWCVCVC